MSLTASNVRVAEDGGRLFVAKLSASATAPTGVGDDLVAGGWTDLGYITEDGLAIAYSKTTEDVPAWQSQNAVRTVTTGQELTIQATMEESSADVAGLWLGADWQANGASEYVAHGSVLAASTEYGVIGEWVDGSITNRFYIARAIVTEQGDLSITKSASVNFQVTFKALAPDSGDLYTWYTNDSAMNPA